MFTGMTSLYLNQMFRLEEQRREQARRWHQDYISPQEEVNATLAGLRRTLGSWFGRRSRSQVETEHAPALSCESYISSSVS